MPTQKQRIQICIEDEMNRVLGKIAIRDGVPLATKAAQLLRIGLEIAEDEAFDAIAESRDTRKTKFIAHKKAWL